MKDLQVLNLMIATVPMMLMVLIGILYNNARLSDLRANIDGRLTDSAARMEHRLSGMQQGMDLRFQGVDQSFLQIGRRFEQVDRRFQETKELWRSQLRRVEEILDARLKHLEES